MIIECTRVQLCFTLTPARVSFIGRGSQVSSPGEMMSNLLVRSGKFRDRVEDFGYEYLSFETRKLEAGQKLSGETVNRELAIVVLGGIC